jgi:hypothetical protein
VSHLPLILFLVFALSFLLPILFRIFSRGPRDRAKVVVKYVQARGYALVNPSLAQAVDMSGLEMLKDPALRNSTKSSSDIADIDGLTNGTGDWFAFTCKLRSKEVTIFNLSVSSTRAGTHGNSIPYKVAKIKSPGLPRFSAGKKSALHTFENAINKIVHASKPEIAIDARLYPEFSTHFWIRGTDQSAVLAFLSSSKINFLENAKLDGVLATNGNYLVYFEDGILQTDQDYDSFVAKADALIANLL